MKRKLLIFGSLLFPLYLSGQDPSVVRLVCAGKMAVAPIDAGNTKTGLFIPTSVLVTGGNVSILQDGKTALSGSFYTDAMTPVFKTNTTGWGTSVGKVSFRDNSTTNERTVSTRNTAITAYDRSTSYVAFPTVEIATNDRITLPGRMGIDATKVSINSGNIGKLYLKSEVYGSGASEALYNASLRLSGSGGSAALTPAGSVVVELGLSPYRIDSDPGTVDDYPLFAFASPFTQQKSGYFAGNWVRKLIPGVNNHVKWVFGNEDANGDGKIDREQYLWNPKESFVPGNSYLVKARPEGFDYNQLKNEGGLVVTGATASLYDKGLFVFDGNIYGSSEIPLYNEQVFGEDNLFSQTVSGSVAATINWVIGNSYTSAIDVEKLVSYMGSHALNFEPSIYVYPAGSTSYQRYVIAPATGVPPVQVFDNLSSIPAMSIFMVRLLPGTQNGTFTLNKNNFLIHSSTAHNTLRSSNKFQNEVLFRVSPESNPNIFDLVAVGIRPNSKEAFDNMDIDKVYAQNSHVFQLYSLSADNKKLSANVVPQGTKSVKLCLTPGENGGRRTLTASRQESIENIWLEDLLAGKMIDLKESDSYSFDSSPNDTPERFVVHFLRSTTAIEDVANNNFLQCYYSGGELVVKGLQAGDMGAMVSIIDMQGRKVMTKTVDQTPEMHLPVTLSEGIYIAKLSGKRNVTVKFMKGGTL